MLDEAVLAVAIPYRQCILEDEDSNLFNRHTAYRKFVLWHHGGLGAGVRSVIHSFVCRIKEKFADALGHVLGFKNGSLHLSVNIHCVVVLHYPVVFTNINVNLNCILFDIIY